MAYDLELAKRYIQVALDTNYPKLNFDYKMEEEVLHVSANLTLNNHDDRLMILISTFKGGMASFRAIFDKVVPQDLAEAISLTNEFNQNYSFMSAFIRKDGYLELRNVIAYYDEKMLGRYTGEFLTRLSNLAKDETLLKLTRITVAE